MEVKVTYVDFTDWGRVKYTCVGDLTIIRSDNGLSPGRRQAIIWNNTGMLLIEPLGTNLNEIIFEIRKLSYIYINSYESIIVRLT